MHVAAALRHIAAVHSLAGPESTDSDRFLPIGVGRTTRTTALVACACRPTLESIEVIRPAGIIGLLQQAYANQAAPTATSLPPTEEMMRKRPREDTSDTMDLGGAEHQDGHPGNSPADGNSAEQKADHHWHHFLAGPASMASLLPGTLAMQNDLTDKLSNASHIPRCFDKIYHPEPDQWVFKIMLHPTLLHSKDDRPVLRDLNAWLKNLANSLELHRTQERDPNQAAFLR